MNGEIQFVRPVGAGPGAQRDVGPILEPAGNVFGAVPAGADRDESLGPIAMRVSAIPGLAIGDVVLSFAALSFLGIGTAIGYADWGQIISFARNWITSLNTYWYIIVWPGLILVFFVMGWNLVGDALRDVLDPRMRGKS